MRVCCGVLVAELGRVGKVTYQIYRAYLRSKFCMGSF